MDEQTAVNLIIFAWRARCGITTITLPGIPHGRLQGTVCTTFDNIREKIGEPSYFNMDKVTVEWCVFANVPNWKTHTFDFVRFTIYDWKELKTPTGLYDWHIGGETKQSFEVARQLLTRQ